MQFANFLTTAVFRLTRKCLFIGVPLAGCMVAPIVYGQSEPTPETGFQGLKGLVSADPPGELLDALDGFPESWTAWTDDTVKELNAFYREMPGEIEGQRTSLIGLKARLHTIDQALSDSRYEPIRGKLLDLRGAISKRIDLFQAVLDTLTDRHPKSDTSSIRQQLLARLTSLEAFLDGAIGGGKWETYLLTNEVRGLLLQHNGAGNDQLPLLNELKTSLKRMRVAKSSRDPEIITFCGYETVKNFHHDLELAVAAIERETNGISWSDIRSEIKRLIGELENYEKSQLLNSAAQVRSAHDRLRELSPDAGGRLTWALRQHYFNSNFHASFTEGFLNRMMATSKVDAGEVRDFILGANVYGSQTTASNSFVDLLPANSGARFQIQLTGDVSNDTNAYASRAVIHTIGQHHFQGVKDVYFNGTTFSTAPAMVNVMASNTPVSASTRADRIPIFGGIARRIALREANRKTPESEAIAAERVDSRVSPRFDSEVDDAFAQLNAQLRDKMALPLQAEQLYPDYIAAMSTDTKVTVSSRLMADWKLGGGAPPIEENGSEDAQISFHETLLNNTLDQLPIAGKTMTEPEFEELVKQKIRKLFPRMKLLDQTRPKIQAVAGEPERIIFADHDPLRVKFEDGKMFLMVRAGFEQKTESGENTPPQLVTIAWTMSLAGDEIVLTRGDVTVEPMTAGENIAQQLLTAGVIKSRLAKSFPNSSVAPRTFSVDRPDKASLSLRVNGLTMQNGWLTVTLVGTTAPSVVNSGNVMIPGTVTFSDGSVQPEFDVVR